MSDELKPCPFCGGPGYLCQIPSASGGERYIWVAKCSLEDGCGVEFLGTSRKVDAIKEWNRRATPRKHIFWGAGDPDCPIEIKARNGELHTLRCKVCGKGPRDLCQTDDVRAYTDDTELAALRAKLDVAEETLDAVLHDNDSKCGACFGNVVIARDALTAIRRGMMTKDESRDKSIQKAYRRQFDALQSGKQHGTADQYAFVFDAGAEWDEGQAAEQVAAAVRAERARIAGIIDDARYVDNEWEPLNDLIDELRADL